VGGHTTINPTPSDEDRKKMVSHSLFLLKGLYSNLNVAQEEDEKARKKAEERIQKERKKAEERQKKIREKVSSLHIPNRNG